MCFLDRSIVLSALLSTALVSCLSADGFEKYPSAPISELKSAVGDWHAKKDHAEIISGHAKSGKQSLRLLGGKNRELTLELGKEADAQTLLSFWAERWTSRGPFAFTVEAKNKGGWKKIYQGDGKVKVGGFHALVEVILPVGTKALRFSSSTAAGSGVLIDDLVIEPAKPMMVKTVTAIQPVIPALIRKKVNPVVGVKIVTEGRLNPNEITGIEVDLAGTGLVEDVKFVQIVSTGTSPKPGGGVAFSEARPSPASTDKPFAFSGKMKLTGGDNYLWVCVELNDSASLDRVIDASVLRVQVDGKKTVTPEVTAPDGAQRIGYAVRQRGDDGSKAYRIPGLTTTNKGTLIGVYDVRYRTGGDLPGDIDVGMSRSTDGGQSWEKMKVIMDMGDDPKWRYDGIGDPAVLVDKKSNRIWVGATWSHGNNSWRGSGQGLKPEETGQVMLAYSDDDGVTWSKPINITRQVKTNPDWHFILHGPGAGITMKDGTLVFAAQYQDESKHSNGKKRAYPFSTIMWSKDQGKTWKLGTGIKGNTTEAQVVELADGSLMLNCRDNRGGFRTIGITKDLGETWTMHPTDRNTLQDPVCMASLLRLEHKTHGPLLFFSNPNTRSGRYNMTLKVSSDEGMTWPEKHHTLYDSRHGSGYSCLTPVGDDHIGVYYEGPHEIYYLRFKIEDLIK